MKKILVFSLTAAAAAFLSYGPAVYAESAAGKTAAHGGAGVEENEGIVSLSGKVRETMDSGGYTYVLLESKGKKTWVAVPSMKVKVGDTLSFMPGAVMVNFESKTLKRKFDRIVFSPGPATGGKGGSLSTGSKDKVVTPSEKIKVDKATGPNAFTVEELYAKRAELDSKEVVVRGKVVKFSSAIMNKNWLHIQDGSGDPSRRNHDLVVTTEGEARVGDIVTAKGTLFKDKDFGSGYSYTVILENAVLKR